MYIISPWSKGGWVDSQVADHTSVAQFIEKRFGVTVPAISPWHRSVSSDLVSAFDFEHPNDPVFPAMPATKDYESIDAASKLLPRADAPDQPSNLYQEKGTKFSRALPYRLDVSPVKSDKGIQLLFQNTGKAGAVFHVYDLHRLDQIPKRYTVEAGKSLDDLWELKDGSYDLEVYGPNGFFRKFAGNNKVANAEISLSMNYKKGGIRLELKNKSAAAISLVLKSNAYNYGSPESLNVAPGKTFKKEWLLAESSNWYDFSVEAGNDFVRRFAGRVETSKPGITDPAMANHL